MTVEEADRAQRGHHPCDVCSKASGVGSMCTEGARLYRQYLRALAKRAGIDPASFPSYKAGAE